jgi:DNA polymerase (family X)
MTNLSNDDVARTFEVFADLLEIKGENPFRVRAYRNAARTLEGLTKPVHDLIEEGEDLTELPGIGKDLADKIEQIIETGHLPALDQLKKKVPDSIVELLKLPSLGPKKAAVLLKELKVRNLSELKEAALKGRIRKLKGFGEKTETRILHELERFESPEAQRLLLVDGDVQAQRLVAFLKKIPGVQQAIVAGSLRRRRETIGDLDILITTKKPEVFEERFTKFEGIGEILSHGTTRSTVRLINGLQVDVRVIAEESFGAALYYFTGSKEHSIAVRGIGVRKGLKINEYGVFKGEKRIAGRTEEEVFKSVGLPYIEPELRENRGEIEAAQAGRLPKLITVEDLKGDLHMHTTSSDGRNTLEEMVEAARKRGYEYAAITDHTQSLRIAHGQSPEEVLKQYEKIDKLNARLKGITILKSAEVDVLEGGRVDLPDDVLKEADVVVISVHSAFRLSEEKQTERLLRAFENRYVNILGHPLGRLIGRREPIQFDIEKVFAAARERGLCLEINAQPQRLDLSDQLCKTAKDSGLSVVISSDSHSTRQLDLIGYGVAQARRGWIEPHDVLNTRSLEEFRKLLRKPR